MTTIIEQLRNNPELHAKAITLSLISKDTTLSPAVRMVAMVELSDLLAPVLLESVKESFAPPKPQYKWVNGAKVRVPGT